MAQKHPLSPVFISFFSMILLTLPRPAWPKENKPPAKEAAAGAVLNDKDLRDLQGKLKSFQHLKVSFTQQTYRSLRKKTSTTTGLAYFSKPDKFRWILQKPKADEWIFDGKTLTHFIPDRKEAISYGSGAQKGKEFRQIVDMVMNFDNLLKRFRIKSASKKADSATITLEPKSKSGDIDEARLTLNLKKNYIEVLQLFFGHGNHTTLKFSSPDRVPIAEQVYRVPAGTKVTKAG